MTAARCDGVSPTRPDKITWFISFLLKAWDNSFCLPMNENRAGASALRLAEGHRKNGLARAAKQHGANFVVARRSPLGAMGR